MSSSEGIQRLIGRTRFHAERLARLLPAPGRAAVKSGRHLVDRPLVRFYRWRSGERSPIPPSSIRLRAGGVGVRTYLDAGRAHARQLQVVLERTGHNLSEYQSILDFGSGAGRVLRHLGEHVSSDASLVGSDVDVDAIAWAQRHLEPRFVTNEATPPLPFGDAEFDLVYSYSVFTHLGEHLQFGWLAELSRVLQPGGLALVTIHGSGAYDFYRNGRLVSHSRSCARRIAGHGDLEAEGIVFEPYEISRWDQRDFPRVADFGMTFHSSDYVRNQWSRWFDVVDVFPTAIGMHDVAVLASKTGS
jgi:SAM-dependent methyltransferase